MPFSTDQDNALLDTLFGATTYLGLSTADPTKDGSGVAEPSGGAYARVEIDSSDWNAAAAGVKTNANTITFPTPTGSWGTPLYVVFYDAASGGNFLAYGAIDMPQAVNLGSTPPSFAAGELQVQAD